MYTTAWKDSGTVSGLNDFTQVYKPHWHITFEGSATVQASSVKIKNRETTSSHSVTRMLFVDVVPYYFSSANVKTGLSGFSKSEDFSTAVSPNSESTNAFKTITVDFSGQSIDLVESVSNWRSGSSFGIALVAGLSYSRNGNGQWLVNAIGGTLTVTASLQAHIKCTWPI